MRKYTIEYWTGETDSTRADTIRGAFANFYSPAVSAVHLWVDGGKAFVTNVHGDLSATITEVRPTGPLPALYRWPVRYHGSIEYAHGQYTACGPDSTGRYTLTPAPDNPYSYGESLYNVRPQSFTRYGHSSYDA